MEYIENKNQGIKSTPTANDNNAHGVKECDKMWISACIKKLCSTACVLLRYTRVYEDRNQVKSKRLEKIYHASPNHKKTKKSIKSGERIRHCKK